jgi:cell division protein FtsL
MARAFHLSSKVSTKGLKGSPLGWLNKLLILTVAVLMVCEALVTNAKASNGSRLAELQREYDALNAEITQMELEVASYSSLAYIKRYASEELKMEPVDKNILYLSWGDAMAPAEEEQ